VGAVSAFAGKPGGFSYHRLRRRCLVQIVAPYEMKSQPLGHTVCRGWPCGQGLNDNRSIPPARIGKPSPWPC
jgi:hypothetical protein